MDIVRTPVEFGYDGRVLHARIDTYYYKGLDEKKNLVLTYSGVTVSVPYDEDVIYFEKLAEEECSLIDKLGKQDYKKFDKYRKDIYRIRKDKIVVNDKVYDFYHDDSVRNGSFAYHLMGIKMKDGVNFDGSSPSRFLHDNHVKSKVKTLENLRFKVQKHYNETRIGPEDRYLNEELTKDYVEKLSWIKSKVKDFD